MATTHRSSTTATSPATTATSAPRWQRATHAPTARAQRQTYSIALRLQRGERIYEG